MLPLRALLLLLLLPVVRRRRRQMTRRWPALRLAGGAEAAGEPRRHLRPPLLLPRPLLVPSASEER